MKFLTLADWSGTAETETFVNGRAFSLRTPPSGIAMN